MNTGNLTHKGCDVEIETVFRFTVRRNGATLHRDDGFDTVGACLHEAKYFIDGIDSDAEEIADLFIAQLREDLTPEQFLKMQERNEDQENPDICHSHDFIDANMSMAQAFEKFMGCEVDVQWDLNVTLWNEAWRLAGPVIRVVPQGEKL